MAQTECSQSQVVWEQLPMLYLPPLPSSSSLTTSKCLTQHWCETAYNRSSSTPPPTMPLPGAPDCLRQLPPQTGLSACRCLTDFHRLCLTGCFNYPAISSTWTHRKYRFSQCLYCSVTSLQKWIWHVTLLHVSTDMPMWPGSNGNVLRELLPSNSHLCWLHSSN
jgi:hypothetical protein